jgi:hypothetical protein
MSEFNEDILENNFIKPEQFYQSLSALESKISAFLNDFKTDFVNFNLNPLNSEYEMAFQNDTNILHTINNDTVQLFQNVEKNNFRLSEILFQLNLLIQEAKTKHKELKTELGMMNNEIDASDELISNYKEMYNYGYLRNWALVICIFASGFTIAKVFSNK